MALSPKQERFVAEYLIDLNATQAAIRAGYSAKTADVQGPRLLGNVRVAEAIEAGKAGRLKASGLTAERVLEELELLAHSDVTHYTVDDNGEIALTENAPPGAMRALQSIKRKITTRTLGDVHEVTREVEFRLWDKPGQLKLAGRHKDVRGFYDKVEHTGKDGGPLEVVTQYQIPENKR